MNYILIAFLLSIGSLFIKQGSPAASHHPSEAKKSINLKHVQSAKVSPAVYKTLHQPKYRKQVKLLGNGKIKAIAGNALWQVNNLNTYLCTPEPETFESNMELENLNNEKLFRLVFEDGSYLFMMCICVNVNDACTNNVTSSEGGGYDFNCSGPDCCYDQWGLIDKDGGGTRF